MNKSLEEIGKLIVKYVDEAAFAHYPRSGPRKGEYVIKFGESFVEWYQRTHSSHPKET